MKPILKYPGGKEKELKYIIPELPDKINNYYEPFVGGGAVYFAFDNVNKYFINDKSTELINFYLNIKSKNTNFIKLLKSIDDTWLNISLYVFNNKSNLIKYFDYDYEIFENKISSFLEKHKDEIEKLYKKEFVYNFDIIKEIKKYLFSKYKLIKKIISSGKLSSDNDIYNNILCSFKSSYYIYLRTISSKNTKLKQFEKAALYFYIREYCYSSMFRFNSKGEFNVPYGGISYNEKFITNKIKNIQNKNIINRLSNTTIENMDFYDFMKKYPPKKNDFVFLDPPYDSDFSTYDKNAFESNDQVRLRNYLINECKGNFMLVIKNTDFISDLYKEKTLCKNGNYLNISSFDKTYLVSFKNRNNKDCEHLLIKNY